MRRPTAGERHGDPERTAARKASRRILARSGLVAVGLIVAYYVLPLDRDFTAGTVVVLTAGLTACGVAFLWQVQAIMRSPYPRLTALAALVSTIPLFLLMFATSYYLIGHGNPASFTEPMSRTDALYFTVTVFSTVGFGDIAPRSETARLLATGQMVLDLFLIGVAARALVSALQEGMRRRRGVLGAASGAEPDEEERRRGDGG
ncbi:MAG: two pore domain potassium channel family protein [Catenulispora sp.]|nr:two pore domain potassium channel family protein [Catenulispora sp.]